MNPFPRLKRQLVFMTKTHYYRISFKHKTLFLHRLFVLKEQGIVALQVVDSTYTHPFPFSSFGIM